MRILIVEDDKIIAENIGEILSSQKTVSEAVHSSADALEKIEAGKYGICEVSGEEIEADRLEAYPSAKT